MNGTHFPDSECDNELFRDAMLEHISASLGAILGLTDLLQKVSVESSQRSYVDGIREAARDLMRVTQEFEERTRSDSLVDTQLVFRLGLTIDRSLQAWSAYAASQGKSLTWETYELPQQAEGNPDGLRRLLLRLVSEGMRRSELEQLDFRFRGRRQGEDLVLEVEGPGEALEAARCLTEELGGEALPGRLVLTYRWVDHQKSPEKRAVLGGSRVLLLCENSNDTNLEMNLQHAGCEVTRFSLGELGLPPSQPLPPVSAVLLSASDRAAEAAFEKLGRNGWPHPAAQPLLLLTETGRPGGARYWQDRGCRAYLSKPRGSERVKEALSAALADPEGPLISVHSLDEAGLVEARILLVDDTATGRKLSSAQLQALGHRVEAVASGAEALERLSQDPFDLVLLDIDMPNPSGLEVAAALRTSGEPWSEIPTVGMAGRSDRRLQDDCFRHGIDDLLLKPLHRESLARTVHHWAGKTVLGRRTGSLEAGPDSPSTVSAPVSASVSPAVSVEHLAEISGGDKEFERELLSTFLDDIDSRIPTLRRAVEQFDGEALRVTAHSLAGSASCIGADLFRERALALEYCGRDGIAVAAPGHLEAFETELSRVKEFLGLYFAED